MLRTAGFPVTGRVAVAAVLVTVLAGSCGSGSTVDAVDSADCQRARDLLATGRPLAEVAAVPAPPRLPGTHRSATVIAPSPDPVEVPAGGSTLGLPDTEAPKLVVVAETDQEPSRLRDQLRNAATAAGWNASNTSESASGGTLTAFSLTYERDGVRGTVSTVSCADDRVLLFLEQRLP